MLCRGCDRTYLADRCPTCERRIAEDEDPGDCPACGRTWDPAACVFCASSDLRPTSLQELMTAPAGWDCEDCGAERWPCPGDRKPTCPKCGSPRALPVFAEADLIPELVDSAAVLGAMGPVLLEVEGRLGKDGDGRTLQTEMECWFRRRGIVDPDEQQAWEDLFFTITGARQGALADKMPTHDDEDEQRDDE